MSLLTSRDAQTANQALENRLTLVQAQEIEDKQRKAQEDIRAAQIIGDIGAELAGDIALRNGWKDGSAEKVILHGVLGAAVTALGGGSAGIGALSGAANEIVVGAMSAYLVDNGYEKGTAAYNEMMTAGSTVLGALVGKAAGGNASEVALAGQVAKSATENNFLKHDQELQFKDALTKCQGDTSCIEKETIKWTLIDEQQTADVNTCGSGRTCADLANDARTGSGYSSAEIDAMCAGVQSCVDFAGSLWRTNSNDSINASDRATSIPVEKNVQRLIDEGLDPRLAETIGLLSPTDLVGLGAGIIGLGKGSGASAAKSTGSGAKFADQAKLTDHFERHGNDFGAKTSLEYQSQADQFLTGSKPANVLEKVRSNGDIVRYNPATDEFGVVSSEGSIRTYYKPDPAVHGKGSNLEYFNAQ